MKLLLDTHILIWSMQSPAKLSRTVIDAMQDRSNERFISIASVWELSIKARLGKLSLSLPFKLWVATTLDSLSASLLPISLEDADRQLQLPFEHRDPFDRMLVAQSLTRGMSIVSVDVVFDRYHVPRIW